MGKRRERALSSRDETAYDTQELTAAGVSCTKSSWSTFQHGWGRGSGLLLATGRGNVNVLLLGSPWEVAHAPVG